MFPSRHEANFTPLRPFPSSKLTFRKSNIETDFKNEVQPGGIVCSFASRHIWNKHAPKRTNEILTNFLAMYKYPWLIVYPVPQKEYDNPKDKDLQGLHAKIEEWILTYGMKKLGPLELALNKYRPEDVVDFALWPDGYYLSPVGTLVIIQAMDVALPRFIQHLPSLLSERDWLACGGERHSVAYSVFSGSFFTHDLFLNYIFQRYDFFVKMDFDIKWLQPLPYDIFARMAEKQCVFTHTGNKQP